MSWAGLVIHRIYTDTYRNLNDTRPIFHKFNVRITKYLDFMKCLQYIYVD